MKGHNLLIVFLNSLQLLDNIQLSRIIQTLCTKMCSLATGHLSSVLEQQGKTPRSRESFRWTSKDRSGIGGQEEGASRCAGRVLECRLPRSFL